MKQQVDTNIIITELDVPSPIEPTIDYETDPLEFHHVNIGLDAKIDVDPTAEDFAKSDAENTE